MEQIAKGLLNWASILEPATREQALQTARMPFVRPHVALMPDAHLGMGSTVGSVIPTVKAVMPASVGVDIGCGMAAVRTQLTKDDIAEVGRLSALREAIEAAVPVSKGGYNRKLTSTAAARVADLEALAERAEFDPASYAGNWRLQLGTLGSGNHFIELCLDEADRLWVFLHSGSRGVGNKIAQRHVRTAQQLCERWHIELPHRDLAYLPEGIGEFWHYIRELRWAQRFALENRAEMLDRIVGLPRRVGGPGDRACRGRPVPPQLHRAGAALRHGRLAHPQGRDRRLGRQARAHPGVDGHPLVRGDGTGQPGLVQLGAARGGP